MHTTHTAEELGGLMESAQAFSFDRVFDPSEDQATVFEEVARPIIDDVMAGFNGTIFAYGQTGSGKTFTMEGGRNPTDMEACGIIPRAVAAIFEGIADADPSVEFTLKASYVEICKLDVSYHVDEDPPVRGLITH